MGFQRVVDSLGIAMKSVDFVAVGVVVDLNSFVHTVEQRYRGFARDARLGYMTRMLVDHGNLVCESSWCFGVEGLWVKRYVFAWTGGWGRV